MMMMNASRLDNAALTAELTRLARSEREATAALIVHLAEFDARRLYEGEGYSSLFRYGMAVLHLSEDAVYNRIAAARAARRYPAIIEGLEKLRTAQDLLGHAIPGGDIAEILDRALTLLVADLSRRKLAATTRPRETRGPSDTSRNIPADVKRNAVARDRDRCAFVARNGRRCGERRFLEFHHVVPHAAGGKATLDNIELRCRAHNGYEVDRYFGPGTRRVRGGARSDDRPVRLAGENWFQNEPAPGGRPLRR